MSNPLSVRRVMVQTIDAAGNPEDAPSYGIVASDNEVTLFCDTWETLASLNDDIDSADSILAAVDFAGGIAFADHARIGKDNFYGADWMAGDGPSDDDPENEFDDADDDDVEDEAEATDEDEPPLFTKDDDAFDAAVRLLMKATGDRLILALGDYSGTCLVPAIMDEKGSDSLAPGVIEYQVSDGPPGARGSSEDFTDFAAAMARFLDVAANGRRTAPKEDPSDA